jgi:hypothetical protein
MLVANVSFVGCEESALDISAAAGTGSDRAPATVQVAGCSFKVGQVNMATRACTQRHSVEPIKAFQQLFK